MASRKSKAPPPGAPEFGFPFGAGDADYFEWAEVHVARYNAQ